LRLRVRVIFELWLGSWLLNNKLVLAFGHQAVVLGCKRRLLGSCLHNSSHSWVEHVLLQIRIHQVRHIGLIQTSRTIKVQVFHLLEALARNCFLVTLVQRLLLAQDGQTHTILDQVGVAGELNQLCILEVVSELTNQTSLNDCLILSLIIINFNGTM